MAEASTNKYGELIARERRIRQTEVAQILWAPYNE